MKKSVSLLVFLLVCSLSSVAAQRQFTVQVGAFIDVRPQDFDPIRSLGFVYADKLDGNVHQVYLGGFSTQDKADQVTAALRQQGYANAQTLEVPIDQGTPRTVIQIATRYVNKNIEWERFEQVGDLYAILDDDKVKVVTGVYSSIDAAKRVLPQVQQMGFNDAFIKNVNSQQLIPVGTFESGLKKPLIPLTFDNRPAPNTTRTNVPPATRTQPTAEKGVVIGTPPVSNQRPGAYNNGNTRILTPRGADEPSINDAPTNVQPRSVAVVEKTPAIPTIRANVKRRSALDLQKILKQKGYYDSSLDGYYGQGTAKAFAGAMARDPELRKYNILSKNYELPIAREERNRLQMAINELLTDPNAPVVIESAKGAVARGYQAYLLFTALGPSTQVNTVMNQAIKEAYAKADPDEAPFDFRATYAYQDLDQLIKHLHFIHAAPGTAYSLPCWLYQQHPKETARARVALGSSEVRMQACDPFQQWEEIRLLQTIAYDMSGTTEVDAKQVTTSAAARSQLYLTKEPLTKADAETAANWHTSLWDNINVWAQRDPLHQQMADALKISYFQSQVRLEDYYMNQGFAAARAKELALATLHTLVSLPLERFA